MATSVGNSHRHHLGESEPEGLDREAISFLKIQGIPAELRLEGWVGPTLFTSELADGMLKRNAAGEWILGTIRETLGSSVALADFVIRGAQVFLLDGQTERFVNRSVPMFVAAIEAFHGAFAERRLGAEIDLSVLVAAEAIDAEAFNAPDGYWSQWVEEFTAD